MIVYGSLLLDILRWIGWYNGEMILLVIAMVLIGWSLMTRKGEELKAKVREVAVWVGIAWVVVEMLSSWLVNR